MEKKNKSKIYQNPSLQIIAFADDVLTGFSTDVGEEYPWAND